MEITLEGVSVKLTADDILSALLSDEGKGLLELKRKLDKLEFDEFKDRDFGNIELSEEDVNDILGLPNNHDFDEFGNILPKIEEKTSSEGNLLTTLKKCQKLKKKHPGRKKKTINPVTGKRYYHPRKKKEIADLLESVKFESNIPCTVTGKRYRSAENNPFL